MNLNYLSNFITTLQQYDFKFDMQYSKDRNEFIFKIKTFKSHYEVVYYNNIDKNKLYYHKYTTLKQLLKQLIKVRKDLIMRYSKDV